MFSLKEIMKKLDIARTLHVPIVFSYRVILCPGKHNYMGGMYPAITEVGGGCSFWPESKKGIG